MVERSLTDRVLGMWEEGWHYSALKELAEAVERLDDARLGLGRAARDHEVRLADLEEVVPKPWRPPPPGSSTFIPKGPTP